MEYVLEQSGAGKIVLVVDDEASVRMVGVEMMAELGFQVLEADSGAAALKILDDRADVALLLTDIRMPGMDGLELARQAAELRPEMKIIFVSGYTTAPTPLPAPLLGKPYGHEQLEKVVTRQLGTGAAS